MSINYNRLAKKYDLSRRTDIGTVIKLASDAQVTLNCVMVDFGCETGNFTYALKQLTNAKIFGIEPLDTMREKAIEKGEGIIFLKGDHTSIPLENDSVDFIYMTDVIHHVPDIIQMFKEFGRVLDNDGRVCVITESHR